MENKNSDKHFRVMTVGALLFGLLSGTPAWANELSRSAFLFQKSLAESGNAEAQFKLAGMYEDGIGTEVDLTSARQWYQKAADNNYPQALVKVKFISNKQ